MAEDNLLEDLSKSLRNNTHKKYVKSYIGEKASGLSAKFDELVRAELSET
jgi:hypothetical protein